MRTISHRQRQLNYELGGHDFRGCNFPPPNPHASINDFAVRYCLSARPGARDAGTMQREPMDNDDLTAAKHLRFQPTRIPKIDALCTFVPIGKEHDQSVSEAHARTGFSRWFPVEGGHRVLFPYEGGQYDSSLFTVEPEAWDHETCKVCRKPIPAMTLCWVTEAGPYVVLCEGCHAKLASDNLSG